MLRQTNRHRGIIIATTALVFTALLVTSVGAFVQGPSSSQQVSRHVSRSASSNTENMVDDKMLSTYDSLATRLINRYNKDLKAKTLRNNQLFVCVAGGPGGGKSTLAQRVAERINEQKDALLSPQNVDNGSSEPAVVLPMDGFHYTRAELKSMGESPDIKYSFEELIARRGAPWTFDAEGCIAAFTLARQKGCAHLPIYSRVKSDPVPDGVSLHPETKIVLLEGNYLLAWDDERWAPLQFNNVFDETWFIACKSLEEQRERLVKRHLETWSEEKTKMWGEGRQGAGAKADANDMLNLKWIEKMSKKYADLVVESI